MLIKVCGMTNPEEIAILDQSGIVDMIGSIFYAGSKRFVSEATHTLSNSKKVGVFVNASEGEIIEKIRSYELDFVQLHGQENPSFCRSIRNYAKVIKAFGIDTNFVFQSLIPYEEVVDLFLFDTATKNHGGSGISFDWDLLEGYCGNKPFLLSGGIGPEHVVAIQQLAHPRCAGIDLNSRFEVTPGRKNIFMIEQFIQTLKNKTHVHTR